MKELKVGDRVVAYCGKDRFIGKIDKVYPDDLLCVWARSDSGMYVHRSIYVHPKQCRRLVKKERRKIFVLPDIVGNHSDNIIKFSDCWITRTRSNQDQIEFIEVVKKK